MKKGLIGERLTHSYSKVIHEYINNDVYNLYSLNKDEFKLFIENKDFNFVNVTIPYKQDVIHYLDEIKLEAKDIGAVNLVINENGKLIGYNTDYYGFKSMLEYNNVSVYNKNCLILGTGGTSKTVFKVLSDLGAKSIYKASRKKDEENKNIISYSDVYNYDFDIIINTTPVGMYPNLNNTVVDCSKFKKIEFIGDVVYNPLRTRLLIDAEKLNIKHDNGLLMLICQAIKAHEIYYKEEVSKEKIIEIKKHIEKEKKNIVLIGMPGSGKSTVGKILGDTCLKEYIDMDQYIEEKTNMSIPKIFAEYGEEYFRSLETEVCKEISLLNGVIISTGGGVIKKRENIEYLKANGVLLYIQRDLEKIILDDNRPLSKNIGDLKRLYNERKSLYEQSADYIIDNNVDIEKVISKIKECDL